MPKVDPILKLARKNQVESLKRMRQEGTDLGNDKFSSKVIDNLAKNPHHYDRAIAKINRKRRED